MSAYNVLAFLDLSHVLTRIVHALFQTQKSSKLYMRNYEYMYMYVAFTITITDWFSVGVSERWTIAGGVLNVMKHTRNLGLKETKH